MDSNLRNALNNEDELELIRCWVESGSENAARELIERLHPQVASIIRGRHRQAEDWPDLEQETFVRVFQNLHRYRPEKRFEHWISRIALNVCRERWRKQSSRAELRWSDLSEAEQRAFDQSDAPDGSESDLVTRDAHSLMLRLMEQLDSTDRLILSLLHQEGYQAPEVAARVGLSKAAVRVRAFRARKRLKKLWESLHREKK